MKRRGFTMIELIFVIVILGILASIAIPKLAATRDDAKVSKVLNELATLKSDMAAYYTAHGTYTTPDKKIKDETNVPLYTDRECSNLAETIESDKKYYYCVPGTGGGNEPLVSITPSNVKGMLKFESQTVHGNIGLAVQSASNYATLTTDVQNGGSRISY